MSNFNTSGIITQKTSVGINELGFTKKITECDDYLNKIKAKFDRIEALMAELSKYYACDEATAAQNKFNEFKVNFEIAKKNISAFNLDLTHARDNFAKINHKILPNQKIRNE